jgi:DNA-binding response OmpR family regulator
MHKSSESAKKILYVDDNTDTCEMVRVVLEPSGYRITTAVSFSDGLRLAKADRFDLYILDNWLPDGIGTELCQTLRALHPSTPILFYSGAGFKADIEKAMSVGADGYLVKPCALEELQKTIVKLLNKHKV